jgi:chromosome segregation ATPase
MLKSSEKLSELTTANAELTTNLETANAKIAELEVEKKDLSSRLDIANTDVATLKTEKTELNGKVATLESEKTELAGKVTRLEGEKKTVDQAADAKSREIAARAGANLPAKAPGAGDQTTDNAGKATGTWRERLTSFWSVQEPETA